jgi:predicted AlkP superfamily pyrophosphatase or phosphodiesterase
MTNVVIVAFDGLQPAQVKQELMPNLAQFVAQGVTFANHHAVFPTVTRINAASMVTGMHPGRHGLTANTLVVRDFDPYLAFSALEPLLAQLAEKTGRVLLQPTLADILSQHGQEYIAVVTGTSGNAYVHNPNAAKSGGATIHPEFCLPYSLHDDIVGRFGEWPESGVTNVDKLVRGVDIATQYVWPEREPAVSFIWFSEPDHAQHAHGVGSEVALKSIAEADEQFGRLLSHLDDDVDVFVISDHGYSTVKEAIDIGALVRDAGFSSGDKPGGVVVAPNGGSALFYTHDSDRETADRLAKWLMSQPWCGALMASDAVAGIEGTVPASVAGMQGERTPELAMSFRWDSVKNEAGYAGHAFSTSLGPGQGQHGSMSRHETHNVLFARGPSFKEELSIDNPTGNIDLAPTVLNILGLSGGEDMDGRILWEALRDGPDPEAVQWRTDTHEAERAVDDGTYRQYVKVSSVGKTTYVDEGLGRVGA